LNTMLEEEQNTENKILAAHRGEGLGSQGGAQQGTGARGEQYLDSPARSHTLAAGILFGLPPMPKGSTTHQQQTKTLLGTISLLLPKLEQTIKCNAIETSKLLSIFSGKVHGQR